jgi:hypothetical protein
MLVCVCDTNTTRTQQSSNYIFSALKKTVHMMVSAAAEGQIMQSSKSRVKKGILFTFRRSLRQKQQWFSFPPFTDKYLITSHVLNAAHPLRMICEAVMSTEQECVCKAAVLRLKQAHFVAMCVSALFLQRRQISIKLNCC